MPPARGSASSTCSTRGSFGREVASGMRSACAPRSSGRTSPVGVCRKYGSTHSSGWPAASGATATSISENASTSGSGPSSLGLFSGRASHASAGIPTALHIASSSTSRRPSFRARIELADSSKLPPLWMFLRTQSSSLRTRATWLSLVSGEPCAGPATLWASAESSRVMRSARKRRSRIWLT
jgi:hypothetical protein